MDLLCLQICSSEKKRKKEKKEKPAHALAVSKMIFVCHSKIDGWTGHTLLEGKQTNCSVMILHVTVETQ